MQLYTCNNPYIGEINILFVYNRPVRLLYIESVLDKSRVTKHIKFTVCSMKEKTVFVQSGE